MRKKTLLFFLFSIGCIAHSQSSIEGKWFHYDSLLLDVPKGSEQLEIQMAYWDTINNIATESGNIKLIERTESRLIDLNTAHKRDYLSFSRALKLDRKFPEETKLNHSSLYLKYLSVLHKGYKSLDSLERCVEISKRKMSVDTSNRSRAHYELATTYNYLGYHDSAVATIESAKRHFKKNGDLISYYNMLGLINREADRQDEAIIAFEKCIEIIETTGVRKTLKPVVYGNLGFCYREIGDKEKAYTYLEFDSKESLKLLYETPHFGTNESHINAEILLAEMDMEAKNYAKAIGRLEELLEFGTSTVNTSKIHLKLSDLYKNTGNISNSYLHLLAHTEIEANKTESQANYRHNVEKELGFLEMESEIQKLQLQKQLADKEVLFQNNLTNYYNSRNNLYLVIGGLILLLIIVLFYRSKGRTRSNT